MSGVYLVTGGAGFIGSHLVEALTGQGKKVRVLDDLSTGLRGNFAHLQPTPEFIEGSVTDPSAVRRAVQGAEVVFHLAAMASVARSIEEPELCHAVCATGTLHVLNAARQAGVRRVVYAASSSAYGLASSEQGQDEDVPLTTLSPYAAAKLGGEFYLQAFTATYGLETVRLRFYNIFGPRQRADSPYSGVIAIFTGLMSQGRTPVVHGDGLQSRDFTYVANAVQALCKASERPGVSGKVFNIGVGASVSVLDLVAALNEVLGTDLRPAHGPARVGDVRFSRADIHRARAELGYEPSVSFLDGLRETVRWYREAGAARS